MEQLNFFEKLKEEYPDPREWSNIKGFEHYEIRMIDEEPWVQIRNKLNKRNLKFCFSCKKYYRVFLSNKKNKTKTIRIHRIIANQYIPNPEKKKTVNHINGIKTDNRIENLEWNTLQENIKHGFDTGILNTTGRNYGGYKGDIEMYKEGVLIRILSGKKEIIKHGLCSTSVYKCVNGKATQYKGYTFKRN